MQVKVPRKIQIDASSHCQLACPVCPTANGKARAVLGAGHLRVENFRQLLDANPEIEEIELSNYGEMFLNPQLSELLACAFERQVTVSGSNGVNLNFARADSLEAVVKYRVRGLTCSIDGATQEIYSQYRVKGDLDAVLENVDRIRQLRRENGSAFPMLVWQFIVFGHNEHEIATAKSMARERGMDFLPRLSWDPGFSPVEDRSLVSIQTGLGAADRAEYREKQGREYARDVCLQLWRAPVVNWDGRMLGCCVNYWRDFGSNVFDTGLSASMSHPDMDYARQMLMGSAEPRAGIPCTTCNHYEMMSQRRGWITQDEINSDERPGILVGLVPVAPEGVKFGRFSVSVNGLPDTGPQKSGTLFRFGLDTAVYFSVPASGVYGVSATLLGPSGWLSTQFSSIDVAKRPTCQQFTFDMRRMDSPVAAGLESGRAEPITCWIR